MCRHGQALSMGASYWALMKLAHVWEIRVTLSVTESGLLHLTKPGELRRRYGIDVKHLRVGIC